MQLDDPPGPLAPQSATERLPALPSDHRTARWTLLRDVVVLQGKLTLDGIKDHVLGPIAVVAALFGIVFEPKAPGRHFYSLLRAGREFDRWVDLYGAREDGSPEGEVQGLDAHVRKLEALLVAQHGRGGLTRQAKQAIDQAIDALQASPDPAEADPPNPRV
jgi:hypothetical protein